MAENIIPNESERRQVTDLIFEALGEAHLGSSADEFNGKISEAGKHAINFGCHDVSRLLSQSTNLALADVSASYEADFRTSKKLIEAYRSLSDTIHSATGKSDVRSLMKSVLDSVESGEWTIGELNLSSMKSYVDEKHLKEAKGLLEQIYSIDMKTIGPLQARRWTKKTTDYLTHGDTEGVERSMREARKWVDSMNTVRGANPKLTLYELLDPKTVESIRRYKSKPEEISKPSTTLVPLIPHGVMLEPPMSPGVQTPKPSGSSRCAKRVKEVLSNGATKVKEKLSKLGEYCRYESMDTPTCAKYAKYAKYAATIGAAALMLYGSCKFGRKVERVQSMSEYTMMGNARDKYMSDARKIAQANIALTEQSQACLDLLSPKQKKKLEKERGNILSVGSALVPSASMPVANIAKPTEQATAAQTPKASKTCEPKVYKHFHNLISQAYENEDIADYSCKKNSHCTILSNWNVFGVWGCDNGLPSDMPYETFIGTINSGKGKVPKSPTAGQEEFEKYAEKSGFRVVMRYVESPIHAIDGKNVYWSLLLQDPDGKHIACVESKIYDRWQKKGIDVSNVLPIGHDSSSYTGSLLNAPRLENKPGQWKFDGE